MNLGAVCEVPSSSYPEGRVRLATVTKYCSISSPQSEATTARVPIHSPQHTVESWRFPTVFLLWHPPSSLFQANAELGLSAADHRMVPYMHSCSRRCRNSGHARQSALGRLLPFAV